MAEGRAGCGLRHSNPKLASPSASTLPTHENDILDHAITEAQKLLDSLKRIKASTGPIEARMTPATRRASRRQSSCPANSGQDELREIAETSWEITRQQNGLFDAVIRRLEGDGKLLPVAKDRCEVRREPSQPPSPEHQSKDVTDSSPHHHAAGEVFKTPPERNKYHALWVRSHEYLDGLPDMLPNYHPDDLPEILPNYHPDDLERLAELSPEILKELSVEVAVKLPSTLVNEMPNGERGFNSDDDGTTLIEPSAEQPGTVSTHIRDPGREESEEGGAISTTHRTSPPIVSIKHGFDDTVLVLYPSMEQWLDFPGILNFARKSGAGRVGAFKVRLSDAVLRHLGPCNMEDPVPRPKKPCNGYRSRRLPNRTFNVTTTNDHRVFRRSDPSTLPLLEAVRHQEYLLRKKQGLKGVFYRTDIPVQSPEERQNAGLPPRSAIWPLDGDMLRHTKQEIPGIHWPYGYESASEFGAMFALHNEDFNLHSVSHLHQGRKIWIMIPPDSAESLEKKMRDTDPSIGHCGQCIRHRSLFVPTTLLDEWDIPYTLVDQRAPEIVVTMPQTYHSGFSTGYTLAEASNYADSEWTPDGYPSCPDSCPDYPIDGALMSFLDPGEIQRKYEPEAEYESGGDEGQQALASVLTAASKTQEKEISAIKTRLAVPTPGEMTQPHRNRSTKKRMSPKLTYQGPKQPGSMLSLDPGSSTNGRKRNSEQHSQPAITKKKKIDVERDALERSGPSLHPVNRNQQTHPLSTPPDLIPLGPG